MEGFFWNLRECLFTKNESDISMFFIILSSSLYINLWDNYFLSIDQY